MDAPPLPLPPADHRQYVGYEPGMGGLQRPEFQTFLSSDQLLQRMPAGLQSAFANQKISRPEAPPNGALGWTTYTPSGPETSVWRGTQDASPYSDVFAARHELTHAANATFPEYRDELANNYPRLRQLTQGLNVNWSDPVHTFTGLADYAYDAPAKLPPPLLDYFAPLLHPKSMTAALPSMYGRGPR